jgi:rod shape-determining protein MreC
MAPPAHRRSGVNRKAQLGVFTGYVVAGFGALFGAALLTISLLRPETFGSLRTLASDVAAPIGVAGATGRTNSQSFFEAIAGYYRAGSRNAELAEEVRIARVRLAEAQAIKQENARLKAVLGLTSAEPPPVAVARLIGSTSSSARRFGYISAGRSDGVRPGMPVTSPMGLVGRVLEAGADSSRVLLLTDSESMVPVRRATDNVVAFAEGRSDGSLRLRLINLGINPIKPGDVFVTSGAGGLFRPGTAVAIATEITRDGAIAQLLSNPAATDIVLVEPIWQPEAVRALRSPPSATTAASGG